MIPGDILLRLISQRGLQIKKFQLFLTYKLENTEETSRKDITGVTNWRKRNVLRGSFSPIPRLFSFPVKKHPSQPSFDYASLSRSLWSCDQFLLFSRNKKFNKIIRIYTGENEQLPGKAPEIELKKAFRWECNAPSGTLCCCTGPRWRCVCRRSGSAGRRSPRSSGASAASAFPGTPVSLHLCKNFWFPDLTSSEPTSTCERIADRTCRSCVGIRSLPFGTAPSSSPPSAPNPPGSSRERCP